MKKAKDCKNIDEIRDCIDSLDMEIIKLFSDRFEFVKEVVKYKSNNTEGIIAKERYDKVLSERGRWAEENGLNGEIISSIYKKLLDYFIEEELKIVNKNNK